MLQTFLAKPLGLCLSHYPTIESDLHYRSPRSLAVTCEMMTAAIVLAAIVVFGVLTHLLCEFLVGSDFSTEVKTPRAGSLSERESSDAQ